MRFPELTYRSSLGIPCLAARRKPFAKAKGNYLTEKFEGKDEEYWGSNTPSA